MKKCAFILFAVLLAASFITQAQAPYVSWEYNFPLPALIMSLTQKSDNSILYGGRTSPDGLNSCFGDSPLVNIWLGNLNSSKNSFSDYCFSMEDYTNSNGLKVIAESDTLYDIFGTTNDTSLFGAENNGGYDVFFMKVNSNGVVRSCRLYGSPGDEGFSSAWRTRDGGWIIGATSNDTGGDVPSHYWSTTSPFPTTDDWVVKLDSAGDIQWSDIIGGTGNQYNPQVIQSSDGYYYMCSYGDSHDYDLSDANPNIGGCTFVVKLDSAGNKKRIGLYGGFGGENDNAALSQLNNGKLFFSGTSDATANWNADSISHGYGDIWVVELDTALIPIWYHLYGTPEDEETQCVDNMLMPDGSIVVAGEHNEGDIYVIRIDSFDGHLLWSDSIIGNRTFGAATYITDGIVLDDNDIMLCGYTTATNGVFGDSSSEHSFLIELSNITGIPPAPVSVDYNLSVYPNPFSQQTTLQFSQPLNSNTQLALYDLIGREVENYTISSGATNLIIKRNNLPAGMYFYKVSGNGMPPLAGKVVIE
jgi:hypothetical protein